MAAAAPSETPQQSNRPSGSAIIGAFSASCFADGLAQMGLRVLGAVGMALDRDMRDGALQVLTRNACVSRDRRWRAARNCPAPNRWRPLRRQRAAAAARQTAVAGVLQLLDAQRQRDIARAGRHGVTAPRNASEPEAQKFSTRVTAMFGRRSAMDSGSPPLPTLISSIVCREPRGVDLVLRRCRRPCMPRQTPRPSALRRPASQRSPNLRTAHAEDRDLVLDALRHVVLLFANVTGSEQRRVRRLAFVRLRPAAAPPSRNSVRSRAGGRKT